MKDHNEGGETQAWTCVPSGLAEVPFSTESPHLPSAQIALHAAGKAPLLAVKGSRAGEVWRQLAAPCQTTDVWTLVYPEADSTMDFKLPRSFLTWRLTKGFSFHSLACNVPLSGSPNLNFPQ